MKKFKIFLLSLIISGIYSCVQEYVPKLTSDDRKKIVVYGNITNQEGFHTINISESSKAYYSQYIPLTNCKVEIIDNLGNIFHGQEFDQGEYKVWVDQEFLNAGTSYKIDIITPYGDQISSEYDIMTKTAELDSLYYKRKTIPTINPELSINGIQFFTDIKGEEGDSKYYKFLLTETWEYHAPYPRQATYDGTLHLITPVDSTKMVCWRTKKVNGIYTLSLENLSEVNFEMNTLHFINDYNEKRAYGYSLIVEQFSLSKSAYNYHNKIKNNNIDEKGLYEKQPDLIKGNIINTSNPDQEVLGFFFASSVTSKRIFVEKLNDPSIVYNDMCNIKVLRNGVIQGVPFAVRPAYILMFGDYPVAWMSDECVDCRARKGVIEKPDFWPNNE